MGGFVAGEKLAGRVLEEGVAALLGLGGQGFTFLHGAKGGKIGLFGGAGVDMFFMCIIQ